jgi:hypothetical protein
MGKPTLWTFAGYVTEAGRHIVQEWYDSLPIEEYEELQDLLNHMASAEKWTRPEFDKVTSPLHEVRVKANIANHEVRVYGVFNPDVRHQFLFLLGVTAKKKDKDKQGQDKALARLALLKQRKASTHEFVIESRSAGSDSTQ